MRFGDHNCPTKLFFKFFCIFRSVSARRPHQCTPSTSTHFYAVWLVVLTLVLTCKLFLKHIIECILDSAKKRCKHDINATQILQWETPHPQNLMSTKCIVNSMSSFQGFQYTKNMMMSIEGRFVQVFKMQDPLIIFLSSISGFSDFQWSHHAYEQLRKRSWTNSSCDLRVSFYRFLKCPIASSNFWSGFEFLRSCIWKCCMKLVSKWPPKKWSSFWAF